MRKFPALKYACCWGPPKSRLHYLLAYDEMGLNGTWTYTHTHAHTQSLTHAEGNGINKN